MQETIGMTADQQFVIQMVTIVTGFIVTITAAWMAFINAQAAKKTAITATNKVAEIHELVNGKMEKLLKATDAAAHAEGKAEGIQEEQERTAPPS